MRHRRAHVLFRRFLFSYVIVMVVTIVIASIVYIASLRTIESEISNNREILLRQSARVMDDYISQLLEITRQIKLNEKLMGYRFSERLEAGSSGVYDLISTHKSLASYTIASPFRENFFIFYARSELVLSRQTINYGFDYHFTYALNQPGVSVESWKDFLLGEVHEGEFLPARDFVVNGRPTSAITYYETVVAPDPADNAVIVVFVEEYEVQDILAAMIGDFPGFGALVNRRGEVMTSVEQYDVSAQSLDLSAVSRSGEGSSDLEIDSVTFQVDTVRSEVGDWTYVTARPDRLLMQNALRIRTLMLAIAGASIVVGLAMSFLLARWNSRPLQEVLAMFRGAVETPEGDAYQALRDNVRRVLDRNETLRERVAEQQSALKSSLVNLLINGDLSDEQDIEDMISYTTFDIADPPYVAIVVRIAHGGAAGETQDIGELEFAGVVVEDVFERHLRGRAEWMWYRPGEIVALLGLGGEKDSRGRSNIEDAVATIQDELDSKYRIRTTIGIGNVQDRLIDTSNSFRAACHALERVGPAGPRMLKYDDVPKSQLIFDYPLEVESRLMGFARAGNVDEVRTILREVWDSNAIDVSPESAIAHNLVAAMFATIYRLVDERNEFGVVLSRIPSAQDQVDRNVHDLFENLSEILETICDISRLGKRSHNQELIERILTYLEEHYLDPNLSIASLTSVFNLSETYFSSFFREQTGILFSHYLEEKRVSHARELLQTRSGATIDAIARSSGYATTRTFRRAFKRVTGVTPSQY